MKFEINSRLKPFDETGYARFIKAGILCLFLCFVSPLNAYDLTIDINTAAVIRTIPETLYGTNITAWDGTQNGSDSRFNNLMIASGAKYMRWPGGSWGDAYLWSDMEGPNGANSWIVSYSETLYMLGITGGTLQPIVNFPGYWYNLDHSDEQAIAAAVAWVQDQKNRTPSAPYWEIGNEVFGPWEAGWDANMCGTYYGDHFADFSTAMKAANSSIKIGAIAQEYNTPDWWNPGLWTRDTLTAAYAKGVVPDFLIIHQYPGTSQRANYNPTLLGHDVDEIGNFTASLNSLITDTVGSQYVGQVKYWMTEWNAGGITTSDDPVNPYERWRLFVSAMFQLQYIMEMATNGWEGSNYWGDMYYWTGGAYPQWYTYPNFYIHPFLTKKFGRELVTTSSSNSIVRAYTSRDDANNLTIFVVNNSPDTNLTAQINIAGLTADTAGEFWLMEGAGTTPTGATSPSQDLQDIKINGSVHPNPLTVSTLSGVSFTSGNTFDINLPKSSILFLRVPIYVPHQEPYGGNAWPIPGTIEAEDYDEGGEGLAYHDTTSGNDPNEYRTDDVDIESCGEGGYNVTSIQTGEWLEYTIDVESTGYYQIEARVASAESNGVFHVAFDGVDATGEVNFPLTGDANTYSSVDFNGVLLQAGQHVMRLAMDSNDWNINWIKLTKIGGGTGKILREWWTNISGGDVNKLTSNSRYPNKPTGRELITSMEGPANYADNYGTRIRGFLNPVTDGNYTFWIAANKSGELRLSSNIDPNNAVRIAYTTSDTNEYEWDKFPEQQSVPVTLWAGQKYYIEVLHKEDYNNDNIAVAWEGPGLSQQIIDGKYLSPYITIKKCAVKAGKTIGLDYISCSGNFEASAEQLAAAGSINIKIYSVADDYLVYEQSIDFNSFRVSRNTYSYTYRLLTGQPGAITSLKFDTGKKTFTLLAKNIDLTGLSCPLYIVFDTGGYAGTAVVGEPIVNGKSSIPLRLLSGYADTMALTKIWAYDYNDPNKDRLNAKGTFTVDDDSTPPDGVTITWGSQTFTIPGEQFTLVQTGRWRSKYYAPDGSILNAYFDFNKCKFTIDIKQTNLTAHSGTVNFGLTFGNYDKTLEVHI